MMNVCPKFFYAPMTSMCPMFFIAATGYQQLHLVIFIAASGYQQLHPAPNFEYLRLCLKV